MTIGENMRKYRILKHLTQLQLAEKSLASRQQICNYEADKMEPSALGLVSITNALGVTPNDLLEGSITVPGAPPEITERVIHLLHMLDPASLRLLADTIDLLQYPNPEDMPSIK